MDSAAHTASAIERAVTLRHRAGRKGAAAWRRTAAAWVLACCLIDTAMLALAWLAADAGEFTIGVGSPGTFAVAVFVAIVVVVLLRRGLYRAGGWLSALEDLRSIAIATTSAAGALLAVGHLTGSDTADEIVRLWAFATVFVGAGRVALNRSQIESRRHGEGLRPTLIVGAGRVGRVIAERLLARPELGLRPVGFLDKNPLGAEEAGGANLPVLGASWDLDRAVEEHGIEDVIITFSTAPDEVLVRIVERCEQLGLDVSIVPRLYEKTTRELVVDHIGALPLIRPRRSDPKGWQFAVKYACDRLAAAVALLVLFPVFVAAAAAVWISMGRPVFFRQARVGLDGRRFDILKFRSMRIANGDAATDDPDADDGPHRVTALGTFLRRTSIDELPQLLNVLRGDMSLVGPRPERPEFAGAFAQSVHRYGDRLRVKSGITGWAQVHGLGRGMDRFSRRSLTERVEWDNYYIENWSLWLDVRILLSTAIAVVRFRQD